MKKFLYLLSVKFLCCFTYGADRFDEYTFLICKVAIERESDEIIRCYNYDKPIVVFDTGIDLPKLDDIYVVYILGKLRDARYIYHVHNLDVKKMNLKLCLDLNDEITLLEFINLLDGRFKKKSNLFGASVKIPYAGTK